MGRPVRRPRRIDDPPRLQPSLGPHLVPGQRILRGRGVPKHVPPRPRARPRPPGPLRGSHLESRVRRRHRHRIPHVRPSGRDRGLCLALPKQALYFVRVHARHGELRRRPVRVHGSGTVSALPGRVHLGPHRPGPVEGARRRNAGRASGLFGVRGRFRGPPVRLRIFRRRPAVRRPFNLPEGGGGQTGLLEHPPLPQSRGRARSQRQSICFNRKLRVRRQPPRGRR